MKQQLRRRYQQLEGALPPSFHFFFETAAGGVRLRDAEGPEKQGDLPAGGWVQKSGWLDRQNEQLRLSRHEAQSGLLRLVGQEASKVPAWLRQSQVLVPSALDQHRHEVPGYHFWSAKSP